MIISRISIQRPVLASMMSLALLLFGLISLRQLPVRELPDIDPPIVSVSTVYPGASAQVVETEVTERMEEVLNTIPGIKSLTSQSREQVSNITIEFEVARNIDNAAQDVRDRVSRVRALLPESIKEPLISKQDADANPVMWIGLFSDLHSPLELTTMAEKQIKNRLQTVSGVSSIVIGGEQRYAVRLWLDSEKMAARQISVLDVQKALFEQNVELPSGRLENLDREMTIQTRGQLKSAGEFNRLIIKNQGADIVRLQDVGEALDGVENERTAARVNSKKCIFLGVVKQSKANTIEVAQGIKKELLDLKTSLPFGVESVINYDESTYIQKATEEVWITLAIAFFLVVIVIYVFLSDLRSTLIPSVAIPISIIGTFAILNWLGYSVNILTLLALVLAIGVVVDDAIVVLEAIHRHIEEGMSPLKASYKAMEEIGFAILAITFSLVAVFTPLAFQKSATGQLFIEFAVAVSGSVLISAFVALSLSPMMASRILRPVHQASKSRLSLFFEGRIAAVTRAYGKTLNWALGHGAVVLFLTLLSLAVMVWFYSLLEKEFLPEEDKGRLLAFVIAPEGSSFEYTDRMVAKTEKVLASIPEVAGFGAVVAPGFSGPGAANSGIVFLRLKEKRDRTVQEIVNGPTGLRARLMSEIEGALVIPQIPKAIGRSFGSPFQLVLQCQDLESLNNYSAELSNLLRREGFLLNVRSSFEVNKPELRVSIDRDRAAALGITVESISRTLRILFGGLDLSRIKVEGKEYEVIAQLKRGSRMVPEDLNRIYVRNQSDQLIQLSSVISHDSGAAPNVIEHYGRLRSSTISGTPAGIPMGTAMERVSQILSTNLPAGYSYTWSGESRDLNEASYEVWYVLILAIVIVYMLLAAQFESLLHPLTVILAVPLAAVGAFGLLLVLSYLNKAGILPHFSAMNINLFSQIGLILLIGLVTKNSILLVEYANQRRRAGLQAEAAMREAGLVRLRPILMTALATIAGILPIAIGFGAGAESRRPMGVAVVGGMISSTILTLYVIPVVYVFLDKFGERLKRWTSRRKTTT